MSEATDKHNAIALEEEQKRQQVVNAFHVVFESKEGELVLRHLREQFRIAESAFQPLSDGRLDPLWGAVRDGQRGVILHIEHVLSLPVQGDANVEKPTLEVIKK